MRSVIHVNEAEQGDTTIIYSTSLINLEMIASPYTLTFLLPPRTQAYKSRLPDVGQWENDTVVEETQGNAGIYTLYSLQDVYSFTSYFYRSSAASGPA